MPHLPITTYNSGNPPGIDAPWLDALGAQVEYIYSTYFLTTPYLFINNVTINGGNTNTYTLTGVGTPTVPSGAKGALVSCFYTGSVAGQFLQMYPHGATVSDVSNYPLMGQAQVNGGQVVATAIVPLDGSGQIDAKASAGGNCTGIHASIYGYIY
jgi:hypothetical protein